jgi:hypothetical protein
MFDAEVLSEHLSENVREAKSETSGEPLTHGPHFWLKGKYLIQPWTISGGALKLHHLFLDLLLSLGCCLREI